MRGLPADQAKWAGCCHCIITAAHLMAILLLAGCPSSFAASESKSFEMKMMYKYSEEFREVMKRRPGMEKVVPGWPRQNTAEFYHELSLHDRHRHASRKLLDTDVYSLLPSNKTTYLASMGGLHYSFIMLGTPRQVFLVALDTGSDLLWVPCDCQQCSVADWTAYGINVQGLEFAVYSPSSSTTSKPVICSDAACTRTLGSPDTCNLNAPQSCTYSANYLSANTSSSGTIVQDVIYLTSETTAARYTADIYFGCGNVQTGDFLDGGAPNGLFGLGPEIYSVPTTFARNEVTKNVFSMCFSPKDGSGRLVFGRKPAASLQSTPLVPISPSIFYVLGIEGIVAGGLRLNVSGRVIFDTGTTLTVFPSNVIKAVGDALVAATSLRSFVYTPTQTISFSYCWNINTTAEQESLSSLSFVFKGGGLWTIYNPLLKIGDQSGNLRYCLGMLDADSLSTPPIIGFNFMDNYEYFFDQETATFSWGQSDCTGSSGNVTIVTPSVSPMASPAPTSDSVPTPAEATSVPPPPPVLAPPPPPGFSLFSGASSNSFHPVHLVLLICSSLFFLLTKGKVVTVGVPQLMQKEEAWFYVVSAGTGDISC